MLLRRITHHIKEQNWFAVALDFSIVVLGVFMGIQAQEWNTTRSEASLERQYLERLHNEVSELIHVDQAAVDINVKDLERQEDIGRYFLEADAQISLTQEHCRALAESHIYIQALASPSTIDELLSTGRILLISDEDVKKSLIRFTQSMAGFEQLVADIQSDRVTLATRFPEHIQLMQEWTDSVCQFEAMKVDPNFKNYFFDNLFRRRAYINKVVRPLLGLRHDLLDSLDHELGLAHSGT